MYISIGGDMAVRDGSIIGIFDLDCCSMSHKTMEYLQNAEKNGVLLNVPRGQDLHVPLFETLSKANCPIRRLERLNPNLEDLFLSLTHDDRYKEHL